MNRELVRQNLSGTGPFVVRTSDGKGFSIQHSEFVRVGRHNLAIEQQSRLLEIIAPLSVDSIRPGKRKMSKLGA